MCHGAVKFVAGRDRRGEAAFRFAPLGGQTFESSFPDITSANLPDSMIVETRDGRMLLQSSGVVYILRQLGGPWPLLGRLLGLVPRVLRDAGYDLVARIRHRIVKKPDGVCPILPPELRGRFDP